MAGDTKTWRIIVEPSGATATVRRDLVYADGRTFDLYTPPASENAPVVVLVSGYQTAAVRQALGARPKDLPAAGSWGQLIAASGMAAVTYVNDDPAPDLDALLRHLKDHGASLGVDANQTALWAASGNVPLALSQLRAARCAALLYGYMLDLEGTTVADAAARFGFVNPKMSIDHLPREVPMFVVRAGRDQTPGLNQTMDRFAAEALARNLPITIANHADAPHAFDYADPTERSRDVVRQVLAFLQLQLRRE